MVDITAFDLCFLLSRCPNLIPLKLSTLLALLDIHLENDLALKVLLLLFLAVGVIKDHLPINVDWILPVVEVVDIPKRCENHLWCLEDSLDSLTLLNLHSLGPLLYVVVVAVL